MTAEVRDLNRPCHHCDGTGPFNLEPLNCLWTAAGDEASADEGLAAAIECGYGTELCRADRAKARAHRRDALAQLDILGAPPAVILGVADVVAQFRRYRDQAEADLSELCVRRLEDEYAKKPAAAGWR